MFLVALHDGKREFVLRRPLTLGLSQCQDGWTLECPELGATVVAEDPLDAVSVFEGDFGEVWDELHPGPPVDEIDRAFLAQLDGLVERVQACPFPHLIVRPGPKN